MYEKYSERVCIYIYIYIYHRCKECLRQWLKEKRHQRKLQPVTTTMCASGVVALVDERITLQAQGAKVRAQGTKVRTSISAS